MDQCNSFKIQGPPASKLSTSSTSKPRKDTSSTASKPPQDTSSAASKPPQTSSKSKPPQSSPRRFLDLEVMSINANGFNNKKESITELIRDEKILICCVQETKMYNLHSYKPDGYNVLHLSPSDPETSMTPYHGLSIIIHKSLRFEWHSPPTKPEIIDRETYCRCLSINLVDHDILISNIYLPAVSSSLSSDENNDKLQKSLDYIEHLHNGNSNIIMMGDLNYDAIRDKGSYRNELINNYIGERFYPIDDKYLSKNDSFTFKSFQQDSLRYLDRILCSIDKSTCTDYKILHDHDQGSDHFPIKASFKIPTAHTPLNKTVSTNIRLKWDTAEEKHIVAYRSTVTKMIKRQIINCKDTRYDNETTKLLCKILQLSAENHIPRSKTGRNPKIACQLWLEMVKPFKLKFQRSSKAVTDTSPASPLYHHLKNQNLKDKLNFKLAIKRFKIQESIIISKQVEAKSNIFKTIRKAETHMENPPKLLEGKTPPEQLQFWQKHYTTTFKGQMTPKQIDSSAQTQFSKINYGETLQAIKKIDTSKSYALHYHFKNCPDVVVHVLTKCYNTWLTQVNSGTEYEAWEFMNATINPILKNGLKPVSEVKSYRPIAQATTIAWIAEQICLERCRKYLMTKPEQFGYKQKHSTCHAIQIAKQFGQLHDSHVALLDASSAFDHISHDRIIKELKVRQMPQQHVNFILGLTFQTHFTIKWFGDTTTETIFPGRGVKQGGCLSANLFSICYDVLINMVKQCPAGIVIHGTLIQILVYADDIAIVSASSHGLKMLYAIVMEFCSQFNDITMNPSKSKIIRMGHASAKKPPISFMSIPTGTSGKYLGAILASKPFETLEIRRCRRSLFGRYNSLLRHSQHLPHFSDTSKRSVLHAYGLPYGLETLEAVTPSICAPHRIMTMKLWPQAYAIKDANNTTIRSRTLYHQVAMTESLPERHRKLRNQFILKARESSNPLIANIIGKLATINGTTQNRN